MAFNQSVCPSLLCLTLLLLCACRVAAMMQRGAEKLGYKDTKDCLFGTYDYKHYCTPKWPYGKGVRAALPPFFGLKEKMPILLGMLMVRKHAPANTFVHCLSCTSACRFIVGCRSLATHI